VIDEKAVTDAVSINQLKPNVANPSPSSSFSDKSVTPVVPPPPPIVPSLGDDALPPPVSMTSIDDTPSTAVMVPKTAVVDVSPPDVAPSITISPPTTSSSSSGGDSIALGDIPLPAIAVGLLALLAVGTFAMRGRSEVLEEKAAGGDNVIVTSPAVVVVVPDVADGLSSSDVSIPYDALARIEYDKWRQLHNKGTFDEAKYTKFKIQYETITSMNMAAKKIARDTGASPQLQTLSANADE
jgi:hypothetical protein